MKAEELEPFVGEHVFLFSRDDQSMPCWVRGVSDGQVWVTETDCDDFHEAVAVGVLLVEVDAVAVGGEDAAEVFAWMREALAS